MVLFYHSMDEFQTTNEWSITLSIIMLKTLYNTSTFIQCNMMVLIEHKITCTLQSSINNSDITLSSTRLYIFVNSSNWIC